MGEERRRRFFLVLGIEEGRSINKNKRVIDDGEEGRRGGDDGLEPNPNHHCESWDGLAHHHFTF